MSDVDFTCKFRYYISDIGVSSRFKSFRYFVAHAAPNFSDSKTSSFLILNHKWDVCVWCASEHQNSIAGSWHIRP